MRLDAQIDELVAAGPAGALVPPSAAAWWRLGASYRLLPRFHQIVGPGWRRQVDSGGERWAGRVDFRHQVHPVVIEVQSQKYHGSLSSQRDDKARRARLENAGFIVAEVWDRDVWHEPDEVRRVVNAALLAVPAGQKCPAGTAKSVS